jgi:hypothetical protein
MIQKRMIVETMKMIGVALRTSNPHQIRRSRAEGIRGVSLGGNGFDFRIDSETAVPHSGHFSSALNVWRE